MPVHDYSAYKQWKSITSKRPYQMKVHFSTTKFNFRRSPQGSYNNLVNLPSQTNNPERQPQVNEKHFPEKLRQRKS